MLNFSSPYNPRQSYKLTSEKKTYQTLKNPKGFSFGKTKGKNANVKN